MYVIKDVSKFILEKMLEKMEFIWNFIADIVDNIQYSYKIVMRGSLL